MGLLLCIGTVLPQVVAMTFVNLLDFLQIPQSQCYAYYFKRKRYLCFPHLVRYDGRRSEGFVIRSPGQLEEFLPICAFQCYDLWAKTRGLEYLRANTQFSSDPSGNTSKVQQYSPRQQIEASPSWWGSLCWAQLLKIPALQCVATGSCWSAFADSKRAPLVFSPDLSWGVPLGRSLGLAKLSFESGCNTDFK